MELEDTWAVVMAGGSGTRFWPASRPGHPKQFLAIGADQPMLRATVARLEGLVPPERVLVVAGESHAERVRDCLPELAEENLLLEPFGRNTLACVALAHFEIERRSPSAVEIHLPADHVVEPARALRESLAEAVHLARARAELVIFGVRPTRPATGYGYLELGPALEGEGAARRVTRFVEKPDRPTAERFLESGSFLWNSGIFVAAAPTLRAALFEHAPEVAARLAAARPASLPAVYAGLPSAPIDVAVLERAANLCALPIEYCWSDVGSWSALPEVLPGDEHGHFHAGGVRVLSLDSTGCVVHGDPGDRVALIGVHDLVVVHAGDTTLVCPRDRSEEIKRLVEESGARD